MLPTFLNFIKNKVLCIHGMWFGYFSIHKLLPLHAIIHVYWGIQLHTQYFLLTTSYQCQIQDFWSRWQEVKNKQMEKGPIWIKSISTVFPSDELQSNPHIIMQGMT